MKKFFLLILYLFCLVNLYAQKNYYDAYEIQTWTPSKNWSSKNPVQTRISFEYLGEETPIITIGEKSSSPLRLIAFTNETRYTTEGVKYISFRAFNDEQVTDFWTVRFFEKTPNGLIQVYLDHGDNYVIKYNVKPFHTFDY